MEQNKLFYGFTYEEVSALWDYDADNGKLTSKNPRRREYTNKIIGYHFIHLGRHQVYSHRVGYFLANGFYNTDLHIDHLNGNGLDNRLCNLRLVTNSDNHRNRKLHKNNKTGHCGVYPNGNKFKVIILGKYYGQHSTLEKAVAVAEKMREVLGFTERHGKAV